MKKYGFTLMEVMIAALVLVIAIVGIMAAFTNYLFLNQSSRNTTFALNDARVILEEIQNTTFSEITTTDWTDWAQDAGLDNLANEIVTVSFADPAADPLQVTVTVSWTEKAGRQRSVSLVTKVTD